MTSPTTTVQGTGWSASDRRCPNLLLEDAAGDVLADDVCSVKFELDQEHSQQLWRVSFLYHLVQSTSRYDCPVHPPCSHVDELWLQLIEGDDSEHDVWLWVDGDEAWIRENTRKDSNLQQLEEGKRDAALQALRRRLERTRCASRPISNNIASRNARIRAATPGQRLAAITWLIYTSKRGEDMDYRCGWSSYSKFSLGELIWTWWDDMHVLFGTLPSFPEQPEGWNRFMRGREAIGCACMNSHVLLESVPDWLRMVAWLEDTNSNVDFLNPYQCQPCRDRASAEYDAFYDADHFWDMPVVPMLLVFSLEALSFLGDQPALLPFSIAMVSKSLLPGSESSMDEDLRSFYDEGDRDIELSPWINSHPRVGRKYLQRYACHFMFHTDRTATAKDFPDDYLRALPGAFAQGAPSLMVLIGILAWILGARFLRLPFSSRSWHDYWGQVLNGSFMERFCVRPLSETAKILRDELRRAHSTMQDSYYVSEPKWDDDLWSNYAAIMEFVKSKFPDPRFKGCPKCHAVYLGVANNHTASPGNGAPQDRNNMNTDPLQKHFGHIPDLTNLINRPGSLPAAGGMYANVYKCRLRQENGSQPYINVAVKVFRPDCYVESQLGTCRSLRREIKVWHILRHRNIVPLLGIVSGFGPMVSAVSPWVSGGSLCTYLERKGEELTLSDRYGLIQDVAEGIKCLHSFPIIHGDLSDNNILVEDDGTACLGDFGLCTVMGGVDGGSSMIRRSVCQGTTPFAAPELVLNTASSSTMSDIYSLGCIMLQVLSGQRPWKNSSSAMIIIALSKGEHVPRPEHQPIRDTDWVFIQRCCSTTNNRPTITEVLDYISVTRASLQEFPTPLTASASSSKTPPGLKRSYREGVDASGLADDSDEDSQDDQDGPPSKRRRSFLRCTQ